MEKARFIQFRSNLFKLYNQIKSYNPNILQPFNQLAVAYPELNTNYTFPDVSVHKAMDEGIEEDLEPKPKKKPKDLVAIEKKLRDSLNEECFMDYTDVTEKLRMDNEDYCLETLRYLEKSESDARKRNVYFSTLKGQVLKRLKEITGKKIRSFLEMTNYKQLHAYFLINLYDLTQEYNKLMYSGAPLSFLKNNIKEIKIICQKDKIFF